MGLVPFYCLQADPDRNAQTPEASPTCQPVKQIFFLMGLFYVTGSKTVSVSVLTPVSEHFRPDWPEGNKRGPIVLQFLWVFSASAHTT